MMQPIFWTDERIDQLKARWKEGASAGVIAHELGVTRNAVIGKISRLRKQQIDIAHRGSGNYPLVFLQGATPVKKQSVKKTSRGFLSNFKRRNGNVIVKGAIVAPAHVPAPVVASKPIAWAALTKDHCRYIISLEGEPVLFCGANHIDGSTYCEGHHALCYDRVLPSIQFSRRWVA
jgi:GcrA cell cycle regulator